MSHMFYSEASQQRDSKQFFERGRTLTQLGAEGVDPKNLDYQAFAKHHGHYEAYQLVIDGLPYQLVYQRGDGGFNHESYTYYLRSQLSLQFQPQPGDNLRFKSGLTTEEREAYLPEFSVYLEDGKYQGSLRTDSNCLERVHPLSRLYDSVSRAGVASSYQRDFVGSSSSADNILKVLNRRLVTNPTLITPIAPEEWVARANQGLI